MAMSNKIYFWVVGAFNGKKFRLGPFPDENAANEYGYEKLTCSFDVVALNTADMNRAGRILKKKNLDDTGDLEGSMQRGIRKPPDEYKKGRW